MADVTAKRRTDRPKLNLEVDGSMLVIHSRLSLNLASHTLEQVCSGHGPCGMGRVAWGVRHAGRAPGKL